MREVIVCLELSIGRRLREIFRICDKNPRSFRLLPRISYGRLKPSLFAIVKSCEAIIRNVYVYDV